MSYWNETTCAFEGPGFAGHVSCECHEKPPIPLDRFGRFNSLAASDAETPVLWISAYNDRFGDLMIGHFTAMDMLTETIAWSFLDGVPEGVAPTQGPSGPRGGVTEPRSRCRQAHGPGRGCRRESSRGLSGCGQPGPAVHLLR